MIDKDDLESARATVAKGFEALQESLAPENLILARRLTDHVAILGEVETGLSNHLLSFHIGRMAAMGMSEDEISDWFAKYARLVCQFLAPAQHILRGESP